MLDAFGHLLCFKLFRHNRPVPNDSVLCGQVQLVQMRDRQVCILKKTLFSHTRNSVVPERKLTNFAVETHSG